MQILRLQITKCIQFSKKTKPWWFTVYRKISNVKRAVWARLRLALPFHFFHFFYWNIKSVSWQTHAKTDTSFFDSESFNFWIEASTTFCKIKSLTFIIRNVKYIAKYLQIFLNDNFFIQYFTIFVTSSDQQALPLINKCKNSCTTGHKSLLTAHCLVSKEFVI